MTPIAISDAGDQRARWPPIFPVGSRDHHGNLEPELARIVSAASQYDYNEGEHIELAPATGSATGVLTNSGHLARDFCATF